MLHSLLTLMLKRLRDSKTMNLQSAPGECGRHRDYLHLLRSGHKSELLVRQMGAKTAAATASMMALDDVALGRAVTEVGAATSLEEVPMWQQGDASLATEDKMAERQALRHDRRVREKLQIFWEAAQRSLQSGGHADADKLHREVLALGPIKPRGLARLLSSPLFSRLLSLTRGLARLLSSPVLSSPLAHQSCGRAPAWEGARVDAASHLQGDDQGL